MSTLVTAAVGATVAVISLSISQAATEVDLATDPNTATFVGVALDDRTGIRNTECDVDGDGLSDLVIGADGANGPTGLKNNCGEVYVIRGARRAWTGTQPITDASWTRIIGQRSTDDLGNGVGCGDINDDGFDDLILCAPYADRDRDGTWTSGQVHLIFGRPDLPPLIDLNVDPGTVIMGTVYEGALCKQPAVADINGDGRLDLLVQDNNALGFGPGTRAGRVYAFFNRAMWPPVIDLRSTTADVTILGPPSESFGLSLTAGDWNGDGKAEIVSLARLGDGKNNARTNSGDIYVTKGRASWPATIDLTNSLADTMVWGPDPNDQAGSVIGLALGDVSGDGSTDLVVGIRLSSGKQNASSLAGEVRVVGSYATMPPEIDLRTQVSSTIWGASTNDQAGVILRLGEVNGDRFVDQVISADWGDGPAEGRSDCGEVSVVRGAANLATELDLASRQQDLLIYGPSAQARAFCTAVPDLNGDGLIDLAIAVNGASSTVLPSIIMVSPYDTDGDGIQQLPDNCPLVANADQLDSNGDARGDACALDWDGDTISDSADCAVTDRTSGRPQAVGSVFVTHDKVLTVTRLSWPLQSTADTYDISRGRVSALGPGSYGACRTSMDQNPADGEFYEVQSPPVGDAYYYLVRGQDLGCGGSGPWGTTSDGVERINADPNACP